MGIAFAVILVKKKSVPDNTIFYVLYENCDYYLGDLEIFKSIKYFHLEVNKITNEKNLKMFVTVS